MAAEDAEPGIGDFSEIVIGRLYKFPDHSAQI